MLLSHTKFMRGKRQLLAENFHVFNLRKSKGQIFQRETQDIGKFGQPKMIPVAPLREKPNLPNVTGFLLLYGATKYKDYIIIITDERTCRYPNSSSYLHPDVEQCSSEL